MRQVDEWVSALVRSAGTEVGVGVPVGVLVGCGAAVLVGCGVAVLAGCGVGVG